MRINAINNTNFTSRRPIKIDQQILQKIKNNAEEGIRKDLYKDIDVFLSNNSTKQKYLEQVNALAQNPDKLKLNRAERKYINNLLITMDLAPNPEKVSEEYLVRNIDRLIKSQ